MTLDESKLSMAWSTTSLAARLCLDMGLHRLKDDSHDPLLGYKKQCFWHIYTLDKGLALNFGRTSNLQDFDITTGYPDSYPWLPNSPWHTFKCCALDFAKVQSKIYEKLFSALGRSQDMGSKTESAQPIIVEIERLIDLCKVVTSSSFNAWLSLMCEQSDFGEVEHPDDFKAILETFTLSLYSMLTLTYSSIRPVHISNTLGFSNECISTARMCLNMHCELSTKFMARADDFYRDYINW